MISVRFQTGTNGRNCHSKYRTHLKKKNQTPPSSPKNILNKCLFNVTIMNNYSANVGNVGNGSNYSHVSNMNNSSRSSEPDYFEVLFEDVSLLVEFTSKDCIEDIYRNVRTEVSKHYDLVDNNFHLFEQGGGIPRMVTKVWQIKSTLFPKFCKR
jgi:hypothetical protein